MESRLARGLPIADPPEPEREQRKDICPLAITPAPVLQTAQLPPVKFLIEGILPDGTSLLTAASKIGKSWMVIDIGLSLSAGKAFLGRQCNQCGVLYLALEDSLNRLQDRMNKILGGKPAPRQFYFATEAPKLDNGLLDTLDDHLMKYPDTRLIIIDTLQKVRGQALPRESSYAQDYREMETIKGFMDKRGVSVLFVHHNRKMKDDGDPFNMISGTNGIMGAADTIWTITKASRAADEATLHVTGRDVAQSDTVIRFDTDTWTWKPMGSADWLAEQRARLEYDGSPIVRTIRKLLEQSPGRRWDGTAKDLMEAGKYIARTYLAVNTTKLGHEIKALDKPLFDYDGIVHASTPTGGNGGRKHSFYYQDLGRFEELEGEQEELPMEFEEEETENG
ncbi:MAG: AAA family ATPase [Oscillibacter sp.]|nr:AAA family ATPase [Oscillibacter sp.]